MMPTLSGVHCDLLVKVLSLDAGCPTPATTTSVAVEFVIPITHHHVGVHVLTLP